MRPLLLWAALAAASAQDFSHVTVEKVADQLQFTEGPVWSRENFLLFSDVPANKILKIGPGDRLPGVFRDDTGYANGNTFDAQGRLFGMVTLKAPLMAGAAYELKAPRKPIKIDHSGGYLTVHWGDKGHFHLCIGDIHVPKDRPDAEQLIRERRPARV